MRDGLVFKNPPAGSPFRAGSHKDGFSLRCISLYPSHQAGIRLSLLHWSVHPHFGTLRCSSFPLYGPQRVNWMAKTPLNLSKGIVPGFLTPFPYWGLRFCSTSIREGVWSTGRLEISFWQLSVECWRHWQNHQCDMSISFYYVPSHLIPWFVFIIALVSPNDKRLRGSLWFLFDYSKMSWMIDKWSILQSWTLACLFLATHKFAGVPSQHTMLALFPFHRERSYFFFLLHSCDIMVV